MICTTRPQKIEGAVTERIDGGKNRAYPGEALSLMNIERQVHVGCLSPRAFGTHLR
jgi:hypothetical protein